MSVEYFWFPRTRVGNVLFQYACARLFAERHGLKLLSTFSPPNGRDLIRITPSIPGDIIEEPVIRITDDEWVRHRRFPGMDFRMLEEGEDLFSGKWPPARYIFVGWFQCSSWYHEHRAEIEKFMIPDPIASVNTRDIVISLRVGKDWRAMNWVIHPKWYLDILAKESFDRLHIVTDEKDDTYLAHFAALDPVVVSTGPKGDWEYLRSFAKIVCSNSSFAWWACFFSKASQIYTFKRWNGVAVNRIGRFPNGTEVDGPFHHEAPF